MICELYLNKAVTKKKKKKTETDKTNKQKEQPPPVLKSLLVKSKENSHDLS